MSDLCLKLSMCIKFANMMIINMLANCYFPMQKREKMVPRTSSVETSPTISAR